jgi:hypothetical protein
MRKKLLMPFVLVVVGSSFIACKKEHYGGVVQSEVASEVNLWLENQKAPSQPNKAANIETLKNNLEFSRSWTEESHDGEQILIVPINEKFRTERNIDNKSILNLVILKDNSGKIRRANIVMYYPKNPTQGNLPRNTFYAIYNTAEPSANGEFRFLSVTGRSLYRLNYENERLRSAGHIQSKSIISARSNDISIVTCTDWYLVTTYYDADGNIVDQTSEFLHRTCSGCDDGMNEGHCQDDPGSGGGTTDVGTDYEYEVARSMSWKVFEFPDNPASTKGIWSVERIRGRRVSSEPQGGHFTTLSNWSNYCDFCGFNDTWERGNHTYQVPTPQSISCTVWGYLVFDGRHYHPDRTNWWTFSGIF